MNAYLVYDPNTGQIVTQRGGGGYYWGIGNGACATRCPPQMQSQQSSMAVAAAAWMPWMAMMQPQSFGGVLPAFGYGAAMCNSHAPAPAPATSISMPTICFPNGMIGLGQPTPQGPAQTCTPTSTTPPPSAPTSTTPPPSAPPAATVQFIALPPPTAMYGANPWFGYSPTAPVATTTTPPPPNHAQQRSCSGDGSAPSPSPSPPPPPPSQVTATPAKSA